VRSALLLGANLAVGAAALGWVLSRFGAPAVALLAGELRVPLLLVVVALVALAFLGYALRWRILLAGIGLDESIAWLAWLRAAGHSVSAIVPSAKLGGEPIRAWMLARRGVPAPAALASVSVDRTLDIAAGAPFACLYAALLVRPGVPELTGALATVSLSAGAIAVGIAVAARRLRRGGGLVTSMVRAVGLHRLSVVHAQMDVIAATESAVARLAAQPGRMARAFAVGVGVNLLVMLEYRCLLSAFGLPAGLIAVVAAIFATGAAHSLPVPAAVGALEGAQMWLFGMLGHPPEVGLAVGLAVRLRELLWMLPGLLYLLGRAVSDAIARRPQTAAAKKPG
jgi:uncharacterized protein (TIRG00374 family)